MKITKKNKRDLEFYFRNRNNFRFSGTFEPLFEPIYLKNGVNGFIAFLSIDNNGKNIPTKHPELLRRLLLCKASLNFHIKLWSESRADGTLPLIELSKKYIFDNYGIKEKEKDVIFSTKILSWINKKPCYFNDIQEQYNLPDWVIKAVENQKVKHYK